MSEIKQISLSEVQKHNKKSDLWIIVHHNVYDVTNYVENHPGGIDSLVEVGGQDSTVGFEDVGHSADARETMESPKIGWLQVQDGGFWKGVLISSIATLSVATGVGLYLEKALAIPHKTPYSYPSHFKPSIHIAKPITKVKGYLQPENYQKVPLIKKEKLSSNTHRLTFKLPKDDTILGLPIGQHISIRAQIDGKSMYPDGLLTGKYLEHLQLGDEIEVRGPKGAMRYRKGMVKEMGMIAGGTGITPMYQLIRAICEDPTDNTSVTLLYGNNTEEDILLREELDNFEKKYPENFRVHHVLSKPPPGWTAGVGYVTKDMAKEKFPGPSNESKVLLCGPPGMVNAMKTNLMELGWQKPRTVSKLPDQVFSF
ncbi:hypothetical protein DID88_004071 [Monilinia fructigena]|uniref:Cytochrome b5 heme-binding domain-containing protein n=1 Tax=Monilinia fructigena TaxID=38457 RepID=A0A395IT00_9HELO|nr:hypothetical protein DID88_004071 [Monilinia fructigena]